MAELACLTGRAGGAKEVLPALEYLAHPVATLPLDEASMAAAAAKELVVVDATRDLSRAQALCRALRTGGDHLAILVVMPEAGLAGLQRDWGASDFLLPSAGPAEIEARVRLLTQRPVVADPDAAIRVGDLVVDPVSYQVRLRSRPLDLTYKEFELLRFLAARARPGLDPGAAPPGGVGLRLLRRHPHRRRARPPSPGQARSRARVDDRHRPWRRLQAAAGRPGQSGARSRTVTKFSRGPPDRPTTRMSGPLSASPGGRPCWSAACSCRSCWSPGCSR